MSVTGEKETWVQYRVKWGGDRVKTSNKWSDLQGCGLDALLRKGDGWGWGQPVEVRQRTVTTTRSEWTWT